MMGRGPAPGADGTSPARGALLLLASAALLAGCGEGDGTVQSTAPAAAPLSVVVEPGETAPGGRLEARVVNDGDADYAYGADYELDRRVGSRWQRVRLPPRPVIEIAYIAPPGGTGPPVAVEVPGNAEPGSLRVVIDRRAPGVGLLAGAFEVTDG
jgi:hypothetical protein